MKLPPPLNWLWDAWMAFSNVLGIVMSKVILTILWFTIFGVYAIILKLIQLVTPSKKPDSYWVDPPEETDMKFQF